MSKTPDELRRILGRGARPPKAPLERDDVERDDDIPPDAYVGAGVDAPVARKGRGALSNRSGRYEREERVGFDDGWGSVARGDDVRARAGVASYVPPMPKTGSDAESGSESVSGSASDSGSASASASASVSVSVSVSAYASDSVPAARVDTIVTTEPIRSIITRNDSPDLPFDRSINPYRGCEHGCIYCFARPSHAYLGLSPGLDFETRIVAKPDAAAVLRKELAKAGYRCEVMAMGTNTDPYQPTEQRLGITRSILEVLAEHEHPVGIVTKNAGILRDIDILAAMAKKNLAHVRLSITTLDAELAGTLEPRASRPRRRIDALRGLAEAGIPVGVMVAPIIPAVTDHEIEAILEAAADAGARWAGHVLIRLPLEIKDLWEEWLRAHVPDRADRVLDLIRQTHDGKLYDATWGVRMRGTGPYAALLDRRFDLACARLGLNASEYALDTTRFKRPHAGPQLTLFPG